MIYLIMEDDQLDQRKNKIKSRYGNLTQAHPQVILAPSQATP